MSDQQKYEYGCVMLSLPMKNWDKVLKCVEKEDLYDEEGFGLEDYPHITILYGLHKDIDNEDLMDYLKSLAPMKVKLKNIDCFENDDFDVLKFNCDADQAILDCRKYLIDNFENTQTFKDYHPHATIAYLNAGKGKEYHVNGEPELELECYEMKYSKPNGERVTIKLKQK